jgi:hypothetical protein
MLAEQASDGSTMAEHLITYPEIKGSKPNALRHQKKMTEKITNVFSPYF